MEKSVLIVFWHGIGDCIVATPAFREFHRKNPKVKINIAVNKRV